MDIFLVDQAHEAENQESFEILGPEVVLCGQFAPKTHVGSGEKYEAIKGKPINVTKGNSDVREPKRSSVILPEYGQMTIEGGTLVVNEIDDGEDSRTLLRGTVQLRLKTTAGERTVKGTFKVKSTTWG